MKSSKEQIEDFEREFIWFPLRYKRLEIPYDNRVYIFNSKGFKLIENGIEKTLNEMSLYELGSLWYLLPMFAGKINEVQE